MGKTTTAAMFADHGIPVWSADAAVQDLYSKDGKGSKAIADLAPGAVENGSVNREILRKKIASDPELLSKIESVVHPLVKQHRSHFIADQSVPIILCDIPLLFETSDPADFDMIVTVTATPEIQHSRVMARPGMTEEHFSTILARQMPDAEKRAKSDYVIDTSFGLEPAREAVNNVLAEIKGQLNA